MDNEKHIKPGAARHLKTLQFTPANTSHPRRVPSPAHGQRTTAVAGPPGFACRASVAPGGGTAGESVWVATKSWVRKPVKRAAPKNAIEREIEEDYDITIYYRILQGVGILGQKTVRQLRPTTRPTGQLLPTG